MKIYEKQKKLFNDDKGLKKKEKPEKNAKGVCVCLSLSNLMIIDFFSSKYYHFFPNHNQFPVIIIVYIWIIID